MPSGSELSEGELSFGWAAWFEQTFQGWAFKGWELRHNFKLPAAFQRYRQDDIFWPKADKLCE